jgi:hypothetical protein
MRDDEEEDENELGLTRLFNWLYISHPPSN